MPDYRAALEGDAGGPYPGGAWFTAAPLRVEGFGTIPVRAFARLPR